MKGYVYTFASLVCRAWPDIEPEEAQAVAENVYGMEVAEGLIAMFVWLIARTQATLVGTRAIACDQCGAPLHPESEHCWCDCVHCGFTNRVG